MEVKEGELATFQCEIIGEPLPNVKWYKDDSEISNDNASITNEGSVHILRIKNCRISDSGTYTVSATNSSGTQSCGASLFVQGMRVASNIRNSIVNVQKVLLVLSKNLIIITFAPIFIQL